MDMHAAGRAGPRTCTWQGGLTVDMHAAGRAGPWTCMRQGGLARGYACGRGANRGHAYDMQGGLAHGLTCREPDMRDVISGVWLVWFFSFPFTITLVSPSLPFTCPPPECVVDGEAVRLQRELDLIKKEELRIQEKVGSGLATHGVYPPRKG